MKKILFIFIFIMVSFCVDVRAEVLGEKVFDKAGKLVVTPYQRGRYYYYFPVDENSDEEQRKIHYKADIEPWIVWGYNKKDKSTIEERVKVFTSTKEGKEIFDKYINTEGTLYYREIHKN